MKLQTAELLENNAAARFFTSKTLTLGGNISVRDKRVKITDLDEDEIGRVWVNRGMFILGVASLAYTVPVEAASEWAKMFEPMQRDSAVALQGADASAAQELRALLPGEAMNGRGKVVDEVSGLVAVAPCPDCGATCRSPAGLASHMRSHRKGAQT